MDIDLLAVLLASVGQFVFGAVWYTFIFGKAWGQIHGFDKLPKAKQKEMMSMMGPIYFLQYLVTFISVFALAKLMELLPNYSGYTLALWLWIGFVVPTQTSGILFSNDPDKYKAKKLAIMAFASLGYLVVAVAILNRFV